MLMLLRPWQCLITSEILCSSIICAAAGLMLMLLRPWPPRRSAAAGKSGIPYWYEPTCQLSKWICSNSLPFYLQDFSSIIPDKTNWKSRGLAKLLMVQLGRATSIKPFYFVKTFLAATFNKKERQAFSCEKCSALNQSSWIPGLQDAAACDAGTSAAAAASTASQTLAARHSLPYHTGTPYFPVFPQANFPLLSLWMKSFHWKPTII